MIQAMSLIHEPESSTDSSEEVHLMKIQIQVRRIRIKKRKKKRRGRHKKGKSGISGASGSTESTWDVEESDEETDSEEDSTEDSEETEETDSSSSGWSVDELIGDDIKDDGAFLWDKPGKFTKLDEFALEAQEMELFDKYEKEHNERLNGNDFVDNNIDDFIGCDFVDKSMISEWKKVIKQRIKENQLLSPRHVINGHNGHNGYDRHSSHSPSHSHSHSHSYNSHNSRSHNSHSSYKSSRHKSKSPPSTSQVHQIHWRVHLQTHHQRHRCQMANHQRRRKREIEIETERKQRVNHLQEPQYHQNPVSHQNFTNSS